MVNCPESRLQEFTLREDFDDEVFSALYLAQVDAVVNYLRFRCGAQEAEDLAANVFARAWMYRVSFDARRGSPEAWLWTMVRNAAADYAKHHRRSLKAIIRPLFRPDSSRDPEADLIAGDDVTRAMRRLADLDREIIALRFGAQYSNRRIAAMLGLSESNVAQRLRRSLGRMRGVLLADSDLGS
jgi:RNA polymerase sigma-70 factor (ECF subfamily)